LTGGRARKAMQAIVLTCDRFRTSTVHMIFKYAQLWPNHPFRFRVPYQDLAATTASERAEYRKSPLGIKATVLTLLADLADEELVYWCIDDKYPIRIDVPTVEGMYRWLALGGAPAVDGLLFCRCNKMWDMRFLTGETVVDDSGNAHLERTSYEQIWIHQFLRVKVLRHLFEAFPAEIPAAKAMDALKREVAKPASHRIFVSHRNFAIFGESTSRGLLTRNCHRSILENGLALPAWHSEVANLEIVMGEMGD
jgi:hypothetical protein